MIFESDKDVIIFLPSNMHINHIFQHLIEISLEYEKYLYKKLLYYLIQILEFTICEKEGKQEENRIKLHVLQI